MTLGVKLAGVTGSGRRVYRYKTAGAGTIRVLDFKNPDSYPVGVVPTVSIPNGTVITDLPDASVATPNSVNGATIVGTTIIQNVDGSLVVPNGSSAGTRITLPPDFKLPALSGQDGDYLIILDYRPVSVAAASGVEGIAGWADTTSSTQANWMLYRNNANAYTFAGIGGTFCSLGVLAVQHNRIALRVIKNNAAGTLALSAWVNGAPISGTTVSQSTIPQPTSVATPTLGCLNFGGLNNGRFGSIEIRNLATDLSVDGKTPESIVAADYAAWSSRFS